MAEEISSNGGQVSTVSGMAEGSGLQATVSEGRAGGVGQGTDNTVLSAGQPEKRERQEDGRSTRNSTGKGNMADRGGDADAAAPAEGSPENGSGEVELPLADPADVDITFPEGLVVDGEMLGSFRQFCVDSGLNARQAQQAADFYLAEQGRRMAQEKELSLKALREGAWSGRFEEKLSKANYATHVIDRHLGGRLRPLLAAGLGNNSVFAEMMSMIGESISEDAFTAQPGVYASSHRQMTTEEYLRTEVFKH